MDLAEHGGWTAKPPAAELAAHWDQHFAACTQARDGLAATVDAIARAGVRMGVVTNGPTDRQRRKLDALGLRDRFDAVLISAELGVEKPDARIFAAATAQLGVDPRDCVFVGDNPEKDVAGAAAAGMRAVWLRAALPWPQQMAPPRESIASLRELLDLVLRPGDLGR